MRPTYAVFIRAATIAVAVMVVFSPAFRGDWLWDDAAELAQNPDVSGAGGLAQIWLSPSHSDYFPLKTTVQWFAWRIWGENVAGYHGLNMFLHALGALLVWRMFSKLQVPLAWFGGLLFAIHPLTVESVAWIAELKNTLSLPPLLLAMIAYIDFSEHGRRRDYVAALSWFLASLLCKTSGVMLPVVLLLYHGWRWRVIGWTAIRRLVPFFAVSLVLGLVTLHFQHERAMAGWAIPIGGPTERSAIAGLASVFYLYKFVLPLNLVPVYPQWTITGRSVMEFLPWAFWLVLLMACWRRRGTWGRHVMFGLGSYIVLVAPVLGFVGMSYMRYSWVADHFVYLPMVPLVGLAAAGAGVLLRRVDARAACWTKLALLAGVVVLAFAGRQYAAIFRGPEALWSYTVQRNPKAWFAFDQLGVALHHAGKLAEAGRQFERVVAAVPGNPEVRNNYGALLLEMASHAEAIEQFEAALRNKPDFPAAHTNLGNALLRVGRTEEAIAAFRNAVRAAPTLVEPRNNLGGALYAAGRTGEAVAELRGAVALNPRYAPAYDNLGRIYIRAGDAAEAIRNYTRAVELAPRDANLRNNLGYALIVAGRREEAAGHLREAVRLAPDHTDAHVNLGGVLYQLGRIDEAIAHFEAALRLNPDLQEARQNLDFLRSK